MQIKEQITDYLNLLEMKHAWNEKKGRFELVFTERKDEKPASSSADDEEQFKYTICIQPTDKWVQVYCDVLPLKEVSPEVRQDLFLDLLAMNRKYAEVCFDFDKKRQVIGTSQEMMVQGFHFDSFRAEFLAVPWAVKRFWTEIAEKYNLK
ncbi:hypothetical protein EU538_07035 [Candidatus Thorarchaeota archaeon]|nr:MAG: hypothetical protein EU538_07035 [Candidatus Thorarchaeota archaeon]